jgi:hypothetical protein
MKNLSNIVLTLAFLFCSYFSFAQVWPKYYGEPNRKDYSYDIIETYDNGYLICGGYYNDISKWTIIIKTDNNGDTLWSKIIDGYNKSLAFDQTGNGDILIVGLTRVVNYEKYDPFVLKLNNCGEKEWCKIFSQPDKSSSAKDIKVSETGDIIILINMFGDYPEETMHLFKLNAQGDVLWKKPFCSGFVHPEGAIPLGNKIIITETNEYLISGKVYWEDPWNPGGAKGIRSLFTLIDSNGNEKWVLPFGLNDTIYGHANNTIQLSDNNFISVGRAFGEQVDREGLIMKFDALGNELEYNQVNFQAIDTSFKVGLFWDIKLKDSLYILASFFDNDPNGQAPPGEIIIDTNQLFSNFETNNYIHYLSNDDPYNILITNDGKILSNSVYEEPNNWDIALSKLNLNLEYDTLDPGNYTYDSLCTTPGLPQSGFIYLDDCDIVTDIPSPEQYYAFINTIPIKAYPNPVSDGSITFEFENTEHLAPPSVPPGGGIFLAIFDIFGKEMHEEKIYKHQGESIVNVQSWQKGIYFAVVYSNGLPVGKCKFVVW